MSLNSFFDSLDDESRFEGWKSSINQKLINLKNIIPIDNRDELTFVGNTIELINSLQLNKSDSFNNTKLIISKRLKECNSLYKKFGK